MNTRSVVACLTVLGACFAVAQEAPPSACSAFTSESQVATLTYLRAAFGVPLAKPILVTSSDLYERTCYRRLQFSVAGESERVILYLSPDQRFLVPRVFDVTSNPQLEAEDEARRVDAKIRSYLSLQKPPTLGPASAPVTIAVFADHQCPFCALGMKILLNRILPALRGQAKIAYLNAPATSHDWAHAAAVATGCVATQSESSFWNITNLLFEHQSEITPGKVHAIIRQEVVNENLNVETYEACSRSEEVATRIKADVEFGLTEAIVGTPTLFINGFRLDGIDPGSIKMVLRKLPIALDESAF